MEQGKQPPCEYDIYVFSLQVQVWVGAAARIGCGTELAVNDLRRNFFEGLRTSFLVYNGAE